jgi:uncharacterized protein involved in response to NO
MARTMAQSRNWAGPAVLSLGFRPFFLLASGWAVLAMALWVGWLAGAVPFDPPLPPLEWHVHALLYGYGGAAVAGFLLTAVPNWTGRLPVVGWPLAGLVALWILARVVTTVPLGLPPAAVAVLDLAFTAALLGFLAREVVAGRNWRNLTVLGPLGVLLLAQGLFHWGPPGVGQRLGVAAIVFLILLIGGRVVPSFTRNWLVRQAPGRAEPAPFGRFDALAMALATMALPVWVALPWHPAAGVLALAAGAVHLARLARCQGHRTGSEPMVWVLHAGYGLAAAGFLILGAAVLAPGHVPLVAAMHLWTAGAMGVMTLAVMTRATLGHTGRALTAGPGTTTIYGLALAAVGARLVAALAPLPGIMELAGALWLGAFGLYLAVYGPMLLAPRVV